MSSTLLYRIASVLLLLFAAGHTVGSLQVDPKWGVDSLVQSMKSTHFNLNGSERTYWDFYIGFALIVTVFLVFAAIAAWQFASLPSATLASMRIATWGFSVCFAVVAYFNWRYFFVVPLVFSVLIFACLTAAAWISSRAH